MASRKYPIGMPFISASIQESNTVKLSLKKDLMIGIHTGTFLDGQSDFTKSSFSNVLSNFSKVLLSIFKN